RHSETCEGNCRSNPAACNFCHHDDGRREGQVCSAGPLDVEQPSKGGKHARHGPRHYTRAHRHTAVAPEYTSKPLSHASPSPNTSLSMSEEILLLDDDRTTLNFLESVLTRAGFTCATVSDPAEALAAVRARPEIAVVVSDIYMPGLTGLQFADQLKSLPLDWPAPAVLM